MYRSFSVPPTSVVGRRSRVVTGSVPRLTAPLTSEAAVVNPFSMGATPGYAQSGELATSTAESRPGGAPFPMIHALILGFDAEHTAKMQGGGGNMTTVLPKGTVIAVYKDRSMLKPHTGLGKRARGYRAAFGTAPPNVDGEAPVYMAVCAEQVTFDCSKLVAVSLAVEHTITIRGVKSTEPLCSGTPIVIGISRDGTDAIVVLPAYDDTAHEVYRSGIVTVSHGAGRDASGEYETQVCLTGENLYSPV